MEDEKAIGENADKYLIYQLGTECFATPLVEIREVIEYRAAKPIPHTTAFFKGVINIRGEIIGVLDLRERLNILGSENPMAELIFETDNGPLAAIVDRVHSVTAIKDTELDRRTTLQPTNHERGYFLGIGKVDDQIFTVLSLRKILTSDQPLPSFR